MVWRIRTGEIVLGLQGGIGNQLFEWAFAAALRASGRRVLYDAVRCRGDRPLMIGPLLPASDRLAVPVGLALAGATKAALLSDRSWPRLVRQRRSGYDPSVLERLGGTSYLLGYFQSMRYFEGVEPEVRESVRRLVDGMLSPSGRRLADELRADPDRVAVHVRRGDYVSDPRAAARHGALGAGYYDRALEHASALGRTRRVWFSDDLEWVREHLARDGDQFCPSDATRHDGGEIALIASCATRIIANSSFSWWGGWLGAPSSPTHPVIAPSTWFADGHSDAGELVPRDWVRL